MSQRQMAPGQLRELQLRNTRIADRGLQNLRGLTKLTTLRLGRTGVSREGMEALSAYLPATRIPPAPAAAIAKQ